jgi:hypothetical protein
MEVQPDIITPEDLQRLFDEQTNRLKGSNLLQTPSVFLIRCILQLNDKSELLQEQMDRLVAEHPELEYQPTKPVVGTSDIFEAPDGSCYALLTYSHPVYVRKFCAEMLIGTVEGREEIEFQAQAILEHPYRNTDKRRRPKFETAEQRQRREQEAAVVAEEIQFKKLERVERRRRRRAEREALALETERERLAREKAERDAKRDKIEAEKQARAEEHEARARARAEAKRQAWLEAHPPKNSRKV